MREFYPSLSLLKLAKETGLDLTYGSDAHAPAEIGRDFEAAVAWAEAAGFEAFAVFENRRKKILPFV